MSVNPPRSRGRRSRPSPDKGALVQLPPGASVDVRRDAIVSVIRATGVPPRHAAMSVGVSSSAYYRLAEDPAFVDAMDEATSVFARRMGAVIAKAAGSLGSWRAAAFWLERRLSSDFGPRIDLQLGLRPPEQEIEEKLTPELRANRLRVLADEAQRRLAP